MSKQEWKDSGVELGHAFKQLGKTFVRSAKTTVDKADDWANGRAPESQAPNSTVYSDGSWRETGKGLGKAVLGMGGALLHTVEDAVDSVDEAIPPYPPQDQPAQNAAARDDIVDENGNPANE